MSSGGVKNILEKATNSFLGSVYLIIIYKAFEGHGASALKFFCVYNWISLMLNHYALAIFGHRLYLKKLVKEIFNLGYGGAFTMSFMVSKYWEDAFTNLDHLFAHYIPTAVKLAHVLEINEFTLLDTSLFQLVMFVIIRNPDKIYEIDFYDRYYDLAICCVAPYSIAVLFQQLIKFVKRLTASKR